MQPQINLNLLNNPFLHIFCFQTTYPIQLKFPNVIWNFLMWSEIVRPDLGQFSIVFLNRPTWPRTIQFCFTESSELKVLWASSTANHSASITFLASDWLVWRHVPVEAANMSLLTLDSTSAHTLLYFHFLYHLTTKMAAMFSVSYY